VSEHPVLYSDTTLEHIWSTINKHHVGDGHGWEGLSTQMDNMLCKPNTACCVQYILLLIQTLKHITTVHTFKERNTHINIIHCTPVYVWKLHLVFSLEDLRQENGTHFYFSQACYIRTFPVFQIIQRRILGRFMKNELETMWQKAVNVSFGLTLFPNLPGVSGKNYGKSLNQNNHFTD